MELLERLIGKCLKIFGLRLSRITSQTEYDVDLYKSLYSAESLRNKRFYKIGAGGFQHPYWTNVDHESDWYAGNKSRTLQGIQYDLFSLQPLPIESNSAEIVYSSHTIEHINDEAAQNMFNESVRILKPGGLFRVTTPNIDLNYRAYNDNDRLYFYWIDFYSTPKNYEKVKYNKPLNKASMEQIILEHFATSVSTLPIDGASKRMDDCEFKRIFQELDYESALNYCTSLCPVKIQKSNVGNHMNWWNKNKVFRMLKNAGFENIYLSGYGQSFSPVLRNINFFDNTHPKVSLYVEAIK